jgi:molybdopterin-guanine dinucleotide biosynthesis protein B
VRELKKRGYRIGTIKHDVHEFDIDHEGKDSWRHKEAGACTVAISSPKKLALVKDVESEEPLDSLASKYFQDVDIILTEGYKKEGKPKIECTRNPSARQTRTLWPLCLTRALTWMRLASSWMTQRVWLTFLKRDS